MPIKGTHTLNKRYFMLDLISKGIFLRNQFLKMKRHFSMYMSLKKASVFSCKKYQVI